MLPCDVSNPSLLFEMHHSTCFCFTLQAPWHFTTSSIQLSKTIQGSLLHNFNEAGCHLLSLFSHVTLRSVGNNKQISYNFYITSDGADWTHDKDFMLSNSSTCTFTIAQKTWSQLTTRNPFSVPFYCQFSNFPWYNIQVTLWKSKQ